MNQHQLKGVENFFKADLPVEPVYGFPIIRRELVQPTSLKGFNYALSTKGTDGEYLHCFLDDYQIERLWNNTDRYLNAVEKFSGILSPDYSLYMDMPHVLQIYSVYKSRWVGAYLQSKGISVIATVSWSDCKSFEYCFAGIEQGSVVAISTVGINSKLKQLAFKKGYEAMLEALKPSQVLIYGRELDGVEGIYYGDYAKTKWRTK